jgi:VWFA-related protein
MKKYRRSRWTRRTKTIMNVKNLGVTALCCMFIIASRYTAAQQPNEAPAPGGPYTFKSNVNVVLVPVLVRDKQDRAVGDLKKEDFQVFDNDKLQVISGFTVERRAAAQLAPVAPVASTGPTLPAPERFIVFLFDDMHLSFSDLAQARKAGTKFLAQSLTEGDMAAVVSLSGRVNSGLTEDRAQLQSAIMKLQPQSLYRTTGSECPPMDYYHADLIENKHNANALEAAIQEVMSCSPGVQLRNIAERLVDSAAVQTLVAGEQDVQVSLGSLKNYVLKMAALPGQRTLILVSPGFLTLTTQALADESQIMDAAAASNVTISALDARGLYISEIDASERGGSSSFSTRLKSEYRRNSMSLSENVMAELAAGTGGTFFHNSNDLEGGFERLAAAPEYLYLLEFSAGNVKKNGSYHRLKVRVDQDHLTVQFRKGYFAPKTPKIKK